jgi:putative transposase
VKYAWIDAQRRDYPLPDMCEVLAVSISGYRAWRRGGKPDRTRLSDPQAVALMRSIHARSRAPTDRGACTGKCRAGDIASA